MGSFHEGKQAQKSMFLSGLSKKDLSYVMQRTVYYNALWKRYERNSRFYEYDTLIVIEEGFSTCILGDNYDFIKMVKHKAEYEGLYFRKI